MTTSIIYFPAMREGAVHLERHQPNPPEATAELPGLWRKAGHQREARGRGGALLSTGSTGCQGGRKETQPVGELPSICLRPWEFCFVI